MTSAAERLKEAKARDEAGIEQDEPEAPKFEAPEPQPEPEAPPTVPDEEEEEAASEPQPEGAMDVATMEALQKATSAYYKRVEKAFGPDNVPPECPSCNGLGFDLTGGAGQPDFSTHEQYRACSECNGWGQVKTGSHVPGQDLHDCPGCVGRGYLEKLPMATVTNGEQAEYGTPAWMGTVAPAPGQ